jgi:prepilin-type processing-associated H-X9-DG protein
MSKASKGFTMIEVLITLGIIIVLMIILLPAINAVREESRLVKCQSNQQQIYNVFISKLNSSHTRLRPENLRHHFEKELGETLEVYQCPNAAVYSQRPTLSVSSIVTTLNSFGFNPRMSRLTGEHDAQKIFSLDYRVVTANVIGPKAPAEEFVQFVAPRHFGMCNVLFFDGHVETRDPTLPTIDALAIDPRYCWVHEKHWRPFTDIHLKRTEVNCVPQNPRVAKAPHTPDDEFPKVIVLNSEIDNENDDEETDVPEMRIPESENAPPTLVYIINANNYLPENTNTTYRIKMGDIHIFDDDKGDNTIILSGTDVNDFEFEGTVLYLKAGVLLDYERRRAHRVSVEIIDHTIEEGHEPVQITYSLNLLDR